MPTRIDSSGPPPTDDTVSSANSLVIDGFVAHRERTNRISKRARTRFERRDWAGLHLDALEWLDESAAVVTGTMARLQTALGSRLGDPALWRQVRPAVETALAVRQDADLGSTFYNSIVRRALGTIGADPETEFTGDIGWVPDPQPLTVTYGVQHSVAATVRRLLDDLAGTRRGAISRPTPQPLPSGSKRRGPEGRQRSRASTCCPS